MADRIMTVNAYTTLDLLVGHAEGHGFEEDAMATLNVRTPRTEPDHVTLELELDNTELDHLPAHADSVTLTAGQARTLAQELTECAKQIESESE
ncbi:DUF6360 family protein [Halocatena pleomorpha]|uniref:Uncharacterized protein n=1 Tax=Halocatena pleomorpha TaxID=1785090 RepID=A0A3P3RGH7_9EURY|nr:DUF6360 family protein [Halocatena pleomorpha]RRJ32511.1 hypothetical protein EIK79_04615 [Halocatena pleomorpha]